MISDSEGYTAWNPGVRPRIPHEYRNLESIFQPECAFGTVDEAAEFASITGLSSEELTEVKAERLALHELIIRVTAHVAIPEGDEEEALGNKFRHITNTIWKYYVQHEIPSIVRIHASVRQQASEASRQILASTLFHSPSSCSRAFRLNIFAKQNAKVDTREFPEDRDHRIIASYKSAGREATDPLLREVYRSLYLVLGSISATNHRVGSDIDLLVKLVTTHVCNRYASQLIGEEISPLVEAAIDQEGYVRARTQSAPVLISIKGASAAGKSSLRSMLKYVMKEQDIDPDLIVTISPDIWRRLLLDYDSLGAAKKYAGYLTSREIGLIDKKLDRYIRKNSDRNHGIPHLVVDRFRFDSFASEQVPRVLDSTYAKFVDTMYMYFVVTPPEETVERGWSRALERGRFKAVEDFLAHSVEAYGGMPKLLQKWMAYSRPNFRYFFLDNRVPKGEFPKVCAVGCRNLLTVIDPRVFVDIVRYQKINIFATSSSDVYPPAKDMAVANNLDFLKQCIRWNSKIEFITEATGRIYLQIQNGKGEIVDADALAEAVADTDTRMILRMIAPGIGLAIP
jgi:thymidylate kinase